MDGGAYVNLVSSGTSVVAVGPGTLITVVVNKAVLSGVITLYDSAALAAGTKIGTITFGGTLKEDPPISTTFGCQFTNGLVVNSTVAADLTFIVSAATAPVPMQLPDVVGWWDFGDRTTLFTDNTRSTLVSADGDLIGSVTDKSGNSNHLTAVAGNGGTTYAAASRGQYKINMNKGRSIVRTDGSDDSYVTPAVTALATWSLFMVASRTPGATQAGGPPGLFNLSSSTAAYNDAGGSFYRWENNQAAGATNLTANPATWQVIGAICSSASALQTYKGAAGATDTSLDPADVATTGTRLRLASRGDGNASVGFFDIGEVVLCRGVLAADNIAKITAYLSSRWAAA